MIQRGETLPAQSEPLAFSRTGGTRRVRTSRVTRDAVPREQTSKDCCVRSESFLPPAGCTDQISASERLPSVSEFLETRRKGWRKRPSYSSQLTSPSCSSSADHHGPSLLPLRSGGSAATAPVCLGLAFVSQPQANSTFWQS